MTEIVTLKFRRGTSTEWKNTTNKLSIGEPGFDLTTGHLKIGDGIRGWNDLPVFSPKETDKDFSSVSLGYLAGSGATAAISLGSHAGEAMQQPSAIAIGTMSGQTGQHIGAVSIGTGAGQNNQGIHSIAIGTGAGRKNQADNTIILNANGGDLNSEHTGSFYVSPVRDAITSNVLFYNTETKEISYGETPFDEPLFDSNVTEIKIGENAGCNSQQQCGIAIGANAGCVEQGGYSIAVGFLAGSYKQADNTVILNASGNILNGIPGQTDSCYVAPIRVVYSNSGLLSLLYDTNTKEIVAYAGNIPNS